MYKVDLNSDLGESFGAYTIGLDEAVIAHISSANVACGYHAGDPLVMDKTVAAAKAPAWRWALTPATLTSWASDAGTWCAPPRRSRPTSSTSWAR